MTSDSNRIIQDLINERFVCDQLYKTLQFLQSGDTNPIITQRVIKEALETYEMNATYGRYTDIDI